MIYYYDALWLIYLEKCKKKFKACF